MKCISCDNEVADDAAVCPHCDAVLDPSLYDAAPPEEDAAPPPPRRPAARPTGTGKPVARRPATKPGGKPAVKKRPASAKPAPRRRDDDDESPQSEKKAAQDWRSQLSEEDWKENAGRAPEAFVPDKALDPNDAMIQARRYLWELPGSDKLALFGTIVLFFSTFLPWKETVADGDVLGIYSSGLLVTGLSALAIAGILVRTRKMMPQLNPLLPWVAQLGCVGVSGLWCLVYLKLSWDSTLAMSPIGNFEVWVSKPAIGLIIGIFAAITSIVGTIFGLKDVGR